MFENILLSAFLMGFLGSSHCMAMCGGIVGVLSQHDACMPKPHQGTLGVVLTYNTGRIASYCCIGLLTGYIGYIGVALFEKDSAMLFSRIFTSVFMLSFGFYLLGWPSFLPFLEKKGQAIWRLISPLTGKLLPIRSLKQSLLLGVIWGWLPCGLVYSAVALSLSTTRPMYGALTMLFFGLGTLPALLMMGLASHKLTQLKQSPYVRRVAGGIIIILALLNLFSIGLLPSTLHAGH